MSDMTTAAEWLKEQRQGLLDEELTKALDDAVASVRELGRKATITLKIEVETAKGITRDDVITIRDDVTVRLPRAPKAAALFFVGEDGGLKLDNPRAPRLPGTHAAAGVAEPDPTEDGVVFIRKDQSHG